jgi:hypothetical protein
MPRFTLDRRTLLKGMLGGAVVSVGLPALEIFYDPILGSAARADCGVFPRRFGLWFWGNGVLPAKWVPPTTGADWTPSEQLAPLAPLRSKLAVISGLDVRTPNTNPHGSGPAGLLAGDDLSVGEAGIARTGTMIGPTIDQIIAAGIGDQTRFSSLEVGVQRSSNGLSHSGPYALNPPETSPMALFERIFGAGFRQPGDETGPDPRLALRQSVLDVVRGEAGRLSPRLGIADRARLESHLDGVRSIEMQIARLQADPPDYAACMLPEAPGELPDLDGRPQMSAVNRVISDLVAMALACDQTRVFSTMYSQPVNNTLFLDTTSGHHQLTHDEPDPQGEVNRIVVAIMHDLHYFLNKLDSIPEGDGTLLDHSMILCTTDVAFGRTHTLEDYPIVVAGSGCGAIRTGMHWRSPAPDNACKLSLTLMRTMLDGLPGSFGRGAGYTEDSLSAIEV